MAAVTRTDVSGIVPYPHRYWKKTDDGLPESFSGFALAEFSSNGELHSDEGQGWPSAHQALGQACESEFGRSPGHWSATNRIGNWVRFEPI